METENTNTVEPGTFVPDPQIVPPKSNTHGEKNISHYLREVIPELPKGFLKNNPARIFNGIFSLTFIGLGAFTLITWELPIIAKLGISGIMGICFSINAYLAHEALHGSIFRSKALQDLVGFIGFAPVLSSPTFWRQQHNKMHHGNTQKLLVDPDAFPTKRVFKQSKYSQRTYKFLPGSGTIRSYFYFFYWFTFHNLMAQSYFRFRNKTYDEIDHFRCTIELIVQFSLVFAFGWLLGWPNLIYGLIIPMLIMNYSLMSYVSTNHNFMPLVKENDPLKSSLTVTNHPLLERLHLNFGYHTEHHLMPKMCMSKAKTLNKILREKFPEDFKTMPKGEALKRLYSTPRVYKNRSTLVDPYTGEEFSTY